MIITVTSPKHGCGQSVTTTNMGAVTSKILENSVSIIDTNKRCTDIESYLSNAFMTKGLDNFYSLYRSGMLDKENFKTCIRSVSENLYIMNSNNCCDFEHDDIVKLIEYVNHFFKVTFVDAAGPTVELSNMFAEMSDYFVVVLRQEKLVIDDFIANEIYKKYPQDKTIIIINKYMDSLNGKTFAYTLDDILKDFRNAELNYKLFVLDFDVDLKNECDTHSLLNYIMGTHTKDNVYVAQMEEICEYILREGGFRLKKDLIESKENTTLFKRFKALFNSNQSKTCETV